MTEENDVLLTAVLIREIQEQNDLTGKQISDATSVYAPMVSRYQKSKTQPGMAKLAKFVSDLGYELNVFIDGTPIKPQEVVEIVDGEPVVVHTADEMIVASVLRHIESSKKMSKADMHRESGISYALIWNYMAARVQPSIPQLMKTCRKLGVKVEFSVVKKAAVPV